MVNYPRELLSIFKFDYLYLKIEMNLTITKRIFLHNDHKIYVKISLDFYTFNNYPLMQTFPPSRSNIKKIFQKLKL